MEGMFAMLILPQKRSGGDNFPVGSTHYLSRWILGDTLTSHRSMKNTTIRLFWLASWGRFYYVVAPFYSTFLLGALFSGPRDSLVFTLLLHTVTT